MSGSDTHRPADGLSERLKPATMPPLDRSVEALLLHHLRLHGMREIVPLVLNKPAIEDVVQARGACATGRPVIVAEPGDAFCEAFAIRRTISAGSGPDVLSLAFDQDKPWHLLRTLHTVQGFQHERGVPVVTHPGDGSAAWLWLAEGSSGILWLGTSLAADLVRYRQGDPVQAEQCNEREMWGFAGERPLYLYEPQLAGESPDERHADWWGCALAGTLERHAGLTPGPILPGGAPGAVILTGDDDQAALENYAAQLNALGDVPITYFLHPKTKLDRASMEQLFTGRRVDLGLHPDALEEPERYAELFREQSAWYASLCGNSPFSVRNHGFLNDGYWGHLPPWREAGVRLSSNLPGLNGRVLNGSLLPARMVWKDALTDHWSLLTAIGDGVVFALGLTGDQAADVVRDLADRIRVSGVPGIIVLNLHPDNIGATLEMHHAVRALCASGFLAWTVRDCVEWFDAGEPDLSTGVQAASHPAAVG